MGYFSKLKKQASKYLDKKDIQRIHKAYLLAESAHQHQKRQSGEPYITHPVAVATTLAELELDTETIVAALLHDVIEDTPIAKNEILEEFGPSVAQLVDGVSKLTQISFANKAEAHAENFRKMVLAMAKDLRVVLVKLADRLHNMQTLSGVSPQKRRRVARETLDIYIPLANRLGMHKLRVQLEDLCFAAIYPARERILRRAVKNVRGNRKEVCNVIEKGIGETCRKYKLKYLDIKSREKHLYSIYRKMRDRRIPFSEIMDMFAFRIIVDSIEDCYRVLGYIHNLYKPVPERFKDYIAIPKANGYKSLHTTLFGPYGVPIEVQIRTEQMHEMAENGIAAHWLYKDQVPHANTEAQVRAQAWVKNLVEMQKSSSSSQEFIENVKIDLFPDEVYVFTPKGDIYELPHGATPVDFAYAVHSELGDNCVAVKIDRQYSLLSAPLLNGQTVEIITRPSGKPNPAWLDFVVTGKARSSIRHYFKYRRSNETSSLGEELLERTLSSLGTSLENLPPENINKVIKELKLDSLEQLFEKLGLGDYTAQLIARRLVHSDLEQDQLDQEMQPLQPMAIRGTEGMAITLAKCCYPIPGDAIVGHINPGKGMTVHTENCKSVADFKKNPDQLIILHWEPEVGKHFEAKISVAINSQSSVLASIIQSIANANGTIDDLYMQRTNKVDQIIILLLSVTNLKHLEKIMRRIDRLKDVSSVMRVRN